MVVATKAMRLGAFSAQGFALVVPQGIPSMLHG